MVHSVPSYGYICMFSECGYVTLGVLVAAFNPEDKSVYRHTTHIDDNHLPANDKLIKNA